MRSHKFNRRRKFETLEGRWMMAADISLDDGVVTVEATNNSDFVLIEMDPDDSDQVLITIKNHLTGALIEQEDYDLDDVQEVVVHALDGNDVIYNNTEIQTRLFGGDDDDYFMGGGGVDIIDGGAGNDHLDGNQGNDQLTGGSGNDRYIFSGSPLFSETSLGFDVVYESASQDFDFLDFAWFEGSVNLDLASTAVQTVNQDFLTLQLSSATGIEKVRGSQFDDVIYGNSRDNHIDGRNGNDRIYGRGGADTLLGNYGNDRLYGEGGLDTLDGGANDDYLDGGFDNYQDLLTGGSGRDKFVAHLRYSLDPVVIDRALDFDEDEDQVVVVWH